MERVNVLFVIPQVERGGSESLVLNIIEGLNTELFKPHLAYFDFFGNSQFLNEFVDAGAPIYHVPREKRFDLSTMMRLSSIIQENQIHLVNAHHYVSFFFSYFGCRIRNKTKLVLTAHSKWEIEDASWKSKLIGRAFLRSIDKVVGVTAEVTKCAINTFHLDPSRTCTILNGIDITRFLSVQRRGTVRQELFANDDTRIIGVVANFRKVKNHTFLIRAFARLVRLYSNVKLVLVGQAFQGDLESSIEEVRSLVASMELENKVIFLGYRTDVADLMSGFDIFCLTSWKEGLPISVIEAMAAGLPVVGTNVDGIREVVISDRTGLLVDPGDVDALVAALESLIKDDDRRLRMGGESRQWAINNFSLQRCIREYEKLFLASVGLGKLAGAKALDL